ncbi:MAG: dTDP-4-dehydrorhamnose reductase [Anaerolineales bacterium]
MNILLLGSNGQLGWELHRAVSTLGPIIALHYPKIDLSQPESLRELLRGLPQKPHVILNATAYTAVDRAETESDLAYAINTHAVRVLAQEANAIGAAIVHYSTDYVFDGEKGSPYTETDRVNPLNVYGASKLTGEEFIADIAAAYIIFRTAWVYSNRRESFVGKTLQWARNNRILRIVDDQTSNPTWARALAEITAQILARGGNDIHGYLRQQRGLYHLAGSGYATRYEWAAEILRLGMTHDTPELQPAKTADFPSPARRPTFSALDCSKFENTFGLRLPNWRDALALAMG